MACSDAVELAKDKSWEEIYQCHRGDWLCWLFKRTNPNDLQLLTLVKGHQANTVRHLMKDKRSIKAVDAAIAFGEGRITKEELDAAVVDAVDAVASVASAAADTTVASAFAVGAVAAIAATVAAAVAVAAVAAIAAAVAVAAVAVAAVASVASAAANTTVAATVAASVAVAAADTTAYTTAAVAASKTENQQLTADIFRKYIPIEKINIKFD